MTTNDTPNENLAGTADEAENLKKYQGGHVVDDRLLQLNTAIETRIKQYINLGSDPNTIKIRFDIPAKDNPPDQPSICVFLYDIQEDLELRVGRAPTYQPTKGTFAPRQTNVRCCYLITYWEKPDQVKSDIGPASQRMVVMNLLLNALLSLTTSIKLLDSDGRACPTFARVIAPSEHLSSLGNFWQSLGDKPLLCLNFSVTIPIDVVPDAVAKAVPVSKQEVEVDQGKSFEEIAAMLKADLMRQAKPTTALERAQLAGIEVEGSPHTEGNQMVAHHLAVTVSGMLDDKVLATVKKAIAAWDTTPPLGSDTTLVTQTDLVKAP